MKTPPAPVVSQVFYEVQRQGFTRFYSMDALSSPMWFLVTENLFNFGKYISPSGGLCEQVRRSILWPAGE